MKLLIENWRRFLAEGAMEEDPDAGRLQPSEVPGELYHATQPTRFSSIQESGLSDKADSRHGAGQEGVSLTTDFEVVKGGNFGNMILVLSGPELAADGNYEFRSVQHPSVQNEAEIRVTMVDSAGGSGSGLDPKVDALGTTIPFRHVQKVVYLQPPPRFEIKWMQENHPDVPFAYYDKETDSIQDY